MIVQDFGLQSSLRGFRGFALFGDLPPLDDHIKYGAKFDVKKMRTDSKLLARFPDFGDRWEKARAISAEVNVAANEPEIQTVVIAERALNSALTASIITIAREADRDKKSSATQAAINRASDQLNAYVGIANQLNDARARVAARVAAQDDARRIAAEADAQRQRAASEAARAEAATSAAAATVRETQVAVDTRALVTEQLTTQKLIAQAVRPKFLGIPVVYWGAGVAALALSGGGYYFVKRRKKKKR